jgi:hypothetical protein
MEVDQDEFVQLSAQIETLQATLIFYLELAGWEIREGLPVRVCGSRSVNPLGPPPVASLFFVRASYWGDTAAANRAGTTRGSLLHRRGDCYL